MVQVSSQWKFAVDRGPDCLFVKIRPPKRPVLADASLADDLWAILATHFTYRLVLEMEDVDRLPDRLVDQLRALQQRIKQHGGMLRLCGLSESCQETLEDYRLNEIARYSSRTDAVVGHHADAIDS